jgi:lipopolysaccharide biosynthesis glycosyltransferase
MPVAAIETLGVPIPAATGRGTERTALAFAFDSAYLTPFKAMVFSMARTGTMLDSPVYLLSDDASLFDDELVKLVADEVILIEGALRDQLYHLAEHHVGRPERASWNRGTCLKWAVFDDFDVDQVLFLDVDMLCLEPIEPLLSMRPDADVVACPQFQRAALEEEGQPAPREVLLERLDGMITERSKRYMGRLNSGVMLIRKPLLSPAFRDELLEYAGQRTAVNEQSHLTNFFREPEKRKRYRLRLISSAYNFHESYLGVVPPVDALSLLKRIKVLHYPGSPKPWLSTITKESRLSSLLWWIYWHDADEHTSGSAPDTESAPAAREA